jgi:hypothetical protein
MRDRIGRNCACGRRSYRAFVWTADGSTERAVGEDEAGADPGAAADAEAVAAVDGSMVGTGVRLGSRESAGELGLAVGRLLGALVADGAGGTVGPLLAGGGASGTVGVVGESWWASRNGRAARTITAQVAPAPTVARSRRRRFAPRRIDS